MMGGVRMPLAMAQMGPPGSRPGQPQGGPQQGRLPPLGENDASFEPAFWRARNGFRDAYLEITQQMYFKLRSQIKAIEAEQGVKAQSGDVNQRLLKLFSFCLRIMTMKDDDLRKEVAAAGFASMLYSVNSARKNLESYLRAYKKQWDAVRAQQAEDAEATKAKQEQLIRKKIEEAVLQRQMQELQNKVVAKHKAAAGLQAGAGEGEQRGATGMLPPMAAIGRAAPAPASKKAGGKRTAAAAGMEASGSGAPPPPADGPVSQNGYSGMDGMMPVEDIGYVRLPGFEDDMGFGPPMGGGLDDFESDAFFPSGGEAMRMEDLLNLGQDSSPAPAAVEPVSDLPQGGGGSPIEGSPAKKIRMEAATAAPAPVADPEAVSGGVVEEQQPHAASGSLSVFDRLEAAVAEAETRALDRPLLPPSNP